jgi:peptidyl-tRNA hydrolase, PTH2 family
MVKQTIIVRADLNMRKGKCASQVSHASLGLFTKRAKISIKDHKLYFEMPFENPSEVTEWLETGFTKICLQCHDEDELLKLYTEASLAGLNTILITDNGTTEFGGVPTVTCCAIGPNDAEEIDKITKHLKLY